jgi:hypothetical protein
MLSLILGGLTQFATAAVTAYNKSKDVSIAAIQSAGGIAAAQAQAMTAWIGHPLSPPSIMCYGLAGWFFKAAFLDKVVGPALGYQWHTDTLSGDLKDIAMIVASGMFFSGIASIVRRGQ